MPSQRPVPEGIRITRVGLVFILFALVVGIAATNTGNNSLYLVLSVMLGLLVVSGIASRANVRGLQIAVRTPDEIFARQPFDLDLELRNGGRYLPRWLLVVWIGERKKARLVPWLPPGGVGKGSIRHRLEQRGRQSIGHRHVSSIFPLGLFRKGMRHRGVREVVVYPEILSDWAGPMGVGSAYGETPSREIGFGHELLALREFRAGDDPRGVHWKRTARTGEMIYTEREAEAGQRISIVCDNGVGRLRESAQEKRFEHLVSEAATAGCYYLDRGYQVELLTRERRLPFGSGRAHRQALLETLAELEPAEVSPRPLIGQDPRAPQLRLAMESTGESVG